MIQNERQYRVTRGQLKRLEAALPEAELTDSGTDVPELVRAGQLNGIRFQIDDLRRELDDYQALRDGGPSAAATDISDLADIPAALIRARIAQRLTQRELAERLGVRPQQVQHDESAGYAQATLDRLCRVADALGLRIQGGTRVEVVERGESAPAAGQRRP